MLLYIKKSWPLNVSAALVLDTQNMTSSCRITSHIHRLSPEKNLQNSLQLWWYSRFIPGEPGLWSSLDDVLLVFAGSWSSSAAAGVWRTTATFTEGPMTTDGGCTRVSKHTEDLSSHFHTGLKQLHFIEQSECKHCILRMLIGLHVTSHVTDQTLFQTYFLRVLGQTCLMRLPWK